MNRSSKIIVGAVLALAVLGACAQTDDKMMAEKKMMMAGEQARAHIGHVMSGWNDTPDGKGLLATAQAEAAIAIQHAEFAVSKTDDIDWMKTHVGHVLNAVDPSAMAKGPGLGYGVIKAAGGAAKHIEFAASSPDASDNVKAHATHVSTSAKNAVARAEQIVKLAKMIADEKSVFAVASWTRELKNLADEMQIGNDPDGDGKVTWKEGEGGLGVADTHMGFMMKAEKMS